MTYATRLSPISDICCVAGPQGDTHKILSRRPPACDNRWGIAESFGTLLPDTEAVRLSLHRPRTSFREQGARRRRPRLDLQGNRKRCCSGGCRAPTSTEDGKQNRVEVHLAQWLKAQAAREAVGELSPTYLRELVRYSRPSGYFSPLLERSIHSLNHGVLEDLWRDLRLGSCSRPGGAWALPSSGPVSPQTAVRASIMAP
jgi:hypothetical protein